MCIAGLEEEMTPDEYERAVLERFRIAWPAPAFEVRHDIRLPGNKTRTDRQVDVAIYTVNQSEPIMLIEAKRHRRPIDAGIAGSTIAMMQDIGSIPSMMVSTTGFSIAAANHLDAEAIGHVTITLAEAMALLWVPTIETRFAVDSAFAEVSGGLVEALRRGDGALFLEMDIPYEEWCAVIDTGLSLFPVATNTILKTIASSHPDDGHRYNAIRVLFEVDDLDVALIRRLQEGETDPDIIELLLERASY